MYPLPPRTTPPTLEAVCANEPLPSTVPLLIEKSKKKALPETVPELIELPPNFVFPACSTTP